VLPISQTATKNRSSIIIIVVVVVVVVVDVVVVVVVTWPAWLVVGRLNDGRRR